MARAFWASEQVLPEQPGVSALFPVQPVRPEVRERYPEQWASSESHPHLVHLRRAELADAAPHPEAWDGLPAFHRAQGAAAARACQPHPPAQCRKSGRPWAEFQDEPDQGPAGPWRHKPIATE